MITRYFVLAVAALFLLTSCSSLSTSNLITIVSSRSPQAAARALIDSKKYSYMRDPTRLASDLRNLQRDFDRLLNLLRGNAGKKWGQQDARLPDCVHYVKYTQGYLSRAIVDFDLGEITVETLDEKNPDASLKDAIVTTLLTPEDPRAVDLFSDNAIKLSSERSPYLLGAGVG